MYAVNQGSTRCKSLQVFTSDQLGRMKELFNNETQKCEVRNNACNQGARIFLLCYCITTQQIMCCYLPFVQSIVFFQNIYSCFSLCYKSTLVLDHISFDLDFRVVAQSNPWLVASFVYQHICVFTRFMEQKKEEEFLELARKDDWLRFVECLRLFSTTVFWR